MGGSNWLGFLCGANAMRDLTEEELKLAPDWATHYFIMGADRALFVDKENRKASDLDMIKSNTCPASYSNWFDDLDLCELKPKKPFNITKHEFGGTVGFVECDGSELTLNCTGCNYVELYKDDAIAIAKSLGVTGEDLK